MPGARNALTQALGLRAGQSFVLLAQVGYEDVASALLRAANELELRVRTFMLDRETCRRELFVQRIAGELEEADGSALVASRTGLPAEFRRAIVNIQGERPGFHMILGYTCPEHTGANWNSAVMVPLLVRRADVVVDGKPLLVRGRYARELRH